MNNNEYIINSGVLVKYNPGENYNKYSCPPLDIVIPDTVVRIEEKAFYEINFNIIEFPEKLEADSKAFVFCTLNELIVPENCPAIKDLSSMFLFYNPTSFRLTIKKKDGTFRKTAMTGHFSPLDISSLNQFDSLLETGRLYDEKMNEENRIIAITDRLKDKENPVDPATKKSFINYMQERISKIIKLTVADENDLDFLIQTGIINKLSISAAQKALKRYKPELLDKCIIEQSSDVNIDPLQEECEKWMVKRKWSAKLQRFRLNDFTNVRLKDGTTAPEIYSKFITAAYMFSWFDKEFELAGQVEKLLDIETYLQVMKQYYDAAYFKEKVILARPICRFADGSTVKRVYNDFAKSKFKDEILEAITLSNTREAWLILDKNDRLKQYAKLYGMKINTLKTQMVDSGLEKKGMKAYDLGNQIVYVQMLPDFTFVVVDPVSEKTSKSLPKKGADPVKYKEAENDFKELKKTIRTIVKGRSNTLLHDFLNGNPMKSTDWKKDYLDNPVLHNVGMLVVWMQDKTTFTITEKGLEDSKGEKYELTDEAVYVAHPMDMKNSDIDYWQNYFLSNHLKQPFTQIWEPVIDPDKISSNIFDNSKIPLYCFTDRDNHGIHVSIINNYGERDISFDDCVATIDKADPYESVTNKTAYIISDFGFREFTKTANHITGYLIRCSADQMILEDNLFINTFLHMLTYAQISKLINFAIENNCPNSLAMLMDYRNKQFSEYDSMDEFILEL